MFTQVFGIDQNHVRHQAYCSGCNRPWGTCGHTNVFPINRSNQRLVLESTILNHHGGSFGPNQQQMLCGGCRNPWGGCTCVGYGPVDLFGNPLQFVGEIMEFQGIVDGNPTEAIEGALLGGGGLGGALEAGIVADVVSDVFDNDDNGGGGLFGGDW